MGRHPLDRARAPKLRLPPRSPLTRSSPGALRTTTGCSGAGSWWPPGSTPRRSRTAAASGDLHLLHAGVYAVGHVPPSPLARAMAAVLACGEGAVLSHRSAAALWQIDPRWRGPVDVTARSQHVQSRSARPPLSNPCQARCNRALRHPRHDTGAHADRPPDVLDDAALARAVNEARVLRRVRLDELAGALERSPGRRATGRLRTFVRHPDAPTRSSFEDAFLDFTRRHRLPRPEPNQRIAGHEVDMLWRARRLVVELDGRAFHDHERAFEADRERDADLLAAGYRVLRITWSRLTGQPHREAERLRALVAGRHTGPTEQPRSTPRHGPG